MLKFLKRIKFDSFRFQEEFSFGLAFSKWCISVDVLLWHLSVNYRTEDQQAEFERVKAFINKAQSIDWDDLDQA